MKIVLLNWLGENDPFGLINKTLANKIQANGRDAIIVNIDENFDENFNNALKLGVDFVITQQGLGLGIKNTNSVQTIWDDLKIPLICIHGDHPSHSPLNHQASSKFVTHLYGCASFSSYANHFIERKVPARFLLLPNIYEGQIDDGTQKIGGDFFVFPKNYDDTKLMQELWKNQFHKSIYDQLYEITRLIKEEFLSGNKLNHHAIIEDCLTPKFFNEFRTQVSPGDELNLRHFIHGLIDKYHRNFISEFILQELVDIKIKIYGRGWQRFSDLKNKNHEFHEFNKNSIDGNFQFKSNYGVLDVPPTNDSLHDRTLRAVANKNSFLIGSSWNSKNYVSGDFADLFFSGVKGDLREKIEKIVQDPNLHRHNCNQFGIAFEQNFSFYRFFKDLENISGLLRV